MDPTEKTETTSSTIWIDEEGFLHFKIKSGAKIDLQELRIIYGVYKKLGLDKHKAFQLIEGGDYFTLDSNARKESLSKRHAYLLATATVNNSLAMLILYRFVQKFEKMDPPIELFSTKNKALDWLRKLKAERNS